MVSSFLSTRAVEAPRALLERAKLQGAARAVIVGADHPNAMEAVAQSVGEGLINPILVGQRAAIEGEAGALGFDISAFEIIDASGDEALSDAGAKRAGSDDVEMVIKGQVHTDAFMGALLQKQANIRIGQRLTHCFSMSLPGNDKALIISDAAVNVAPDLKTLQAATQNAIALARACGVERPRAAVLSATESVLEQMPTSVQADAITRWASTAITNGDVYGPLAFDNAVSVDAAKLKGITSLVAGNADILIVPNIEMGNGLFKMMVYFMGACAAGVVMGGRIPIVLTSRADPAAARLASIALARVYQAYKDC